jgi:hypothetical protein
MFWQKLIRRQPLPNRNETDEALENTESGPNLEKFLTLPALIFLNVSNSIGSGKFLTLL